MAAVMTVPPLAPRPSPRPLAAWSPPKHPVDSKEYRPALKQLQQTSPPSRSRRERPCDGCRKRKSKCVLQEDRRCVLCEFHKQECTFVENAQPRKRKAHESTTQQSPPSKKSTLILQRPATAPTGPSRPTTRDSKLSFALTTPTTQLSMRKPFAVDKTLSLQRRRHCKYLGQTTALDACLIGLGSFNDKNETESTVGTLRQVNSTEYFSTHADADVQIPDDEARALAEIDQVIGSHGPALVDIYFRNVHPSYPIIQKQAFLDRHQHGDRQFNPPLLAAMYLLALSWWEQDPSVSSHPKPDMARLEYIAITSLTIAMQRPKMSAVQAGLLLLQRPKSSKWTLTVQLVALGQDIGLHLDCSDWYIPRWERLLRKRLAWALYMQDKWSAVMHGRPSHINAADWNVSEPTEEDFDESISESATSHLDNETEEERQGRMVFMQMISLTSIMSQVCDTFYSESAKAAATSTQLVLNRAKPVQIRLKDWFARLPPECKMDNTTSHLQAYLHLAYFATEISIHRRIVQSLASAGASASESYMLYICRSAAKTRLISALDFVNRLKPAHLQSFWFFASASNFALIGTFGTLLMATAPGREEAEFYACRLREFEWTLGVSCKRAQWISGAVGILGANWSLLKGLGDKPETFGDEGMGRMNDIVVGSEMHRGLGMLSGEMSMDMDMDLGRERERERERERDMDQESWQSGETGTMSL